MMGISEAPAGVGTEEGAPEVTTNPGPMEVMIGDLILSLPPRQMKIKQTLKIDEIEIPGRSGKVKQPTGYEDSEITIELEIPHQEIGMLVVKTAGERYQEIQSLFRPSSDTIQAPIPIVSTLTEACGIEQVLIKDIDLQDDPEYDYLVCTLTLTEYDSIANQLLEQAQAVTAASEATAEVEANMPEELKNPPDNYLVDQFNSGKAFVMSEEPLESAGDDTG
ncbi:MAG: hypothetical protein H8E87_00535 [FCB group bacterium]|nr:hypothetical protein [FCB group bacterium]